MEIWQVEYHCHVGYDDDEINIKVFIRIKWLNWNVISNLLSSRVWISLWNWNAYQCNIKYFIGNVKTSILSCDKPRKIQICVNFLSSLESFIVGLKRYFLFCQFEELMTDFVNRPVPFSRDGMYFLGRDEVLRKEIWTLLERCILSACMF